MEKKYLNIFTSLNLLTIVCFLGLSSCSTEPNSNDNQGIDSLSKKSEVVAATPKSLSDDLLVEFEGKQASYTLLNQYGEEMIVSGSFIKVPESSYKVVFGVNNQVKMYQMRKGSSEPIELAGDYHILKDNHQFYELRCELSYEKASNPYSYLMTLHKQDLTLICTIDNQPSIQLKKATPKKELVMDAYFEGILLNEFMYHGDWDIEIQMTAGPLAGKSVHFYELGDVTGDVILGAEDPENFNKPVTGVLRYNEKLSSWKLKVLNFR